MAGQVDGIVVAQDWAGAGLGPYAFDSHFRFSLQLFSESQPRWFSAAKRVTYSLQGVLRGCKVGVH